MSTGQSEEGIQLFCVLYEIKTTKTPPPCGVPILTNLSNASIV